MFCAANVSRYTVYHLKAYARVPSNRVMLGTGQILHSVNQTLCGWGLLLLIWLPHGVQLLFVGRRSHNSCYNIK